MGTINEIRELAELSLPNFIRLVAPNRMLSSCHLDVINWWERPQAKSHQLLLFPRDHMKVLAAEEPVLMSDGTWKKTIELQLGDRLSDPETGGEQEIIQLHPIMDDDFYRITFDDGRTVECGVGHLWQIEQQGFKEDNPIVRDTLWIKDHYKRERYETRTGNYFTEHKTAIKAPVPLEFPEKDLLLDPYLLGAWLGDGTSKSGAITTADYEICEAFKEKGFTVTNHKSKYGYGILKLSSILRALNVFNNKHVPEIYLQGSIEQRFSLLQGLLDTDGTINKRSGIVSFSQTIQREHLADSVIYLVRSLGGKAKKCYIDSKANGKVYPSVFVNIWLPEELGNPFRLERKAKIYEESARFKPQMLKTWITNVEYIGRKVSRCITVSNPSGLYLANNFIVTHNSALIAFRVAWYLTKDPTLRILYISSTSNLAQKQLGFIKGIFESNIHKRYWPNHIHPDEGKRAMWKANEIMLDHPLRIKEQIRDPSIFTGGLTTNLTGMHCDIAVLDDIVTSDNAYTADGREKVKQQYSLLSSIEGAEAKEWVVGTRYHPSDLYSDLLTMQQDIFDEDGNIEGSEPIYEVYERAVEDRGDGTGEFLWPRQQRKDNKWFGFNREILARKRGQYLDRTQFRAQYYNDPSNPDDVPVHPEKFQYYDPKFLVNDRGRWYFKNNRLNLFASVDFAYTIGKRSDYTAIVVIGIDKDSNIYILDIDRFKTDRISEYYERILALVSKWGFRKLRAEVTAAQSVIVNDLKLNYIKPNGISLSIDEFRPTRTMGSKEERISAALEPRYDNLQIWHYKGGNCHLLEEELMSRNPAHDDIKDALASVVEIAVKPSGPLASRHQDSFFGSNTNNQSSQMFHSRFGGRV